MVEMPILEAVSYTHLDVYKRQTLMDFRYKRKYTAPEGGKGGASLCHGKNAENLVIKVPLGTVRCV